MYEHVIVAIDIAHLTESKAIIDVAVEHASRDARITLFHVVEDIPNAAAVELPANFREKEIETARAELQAVVDASGAAMDVAVRAGHSYSTIVSYAEEKDADLIIIASHRPGLKDFFIGSTASRVVRHAHCSVLIVR